MATSRSIPGRWIGRMDGLYRLNLNHFAQKPSIFTEINPQSPPPLPLSPPQHCRWCPRPPAPTGRTPARAAGSTSRTCFLASTPIPPPLRGRRASLRARPGAPQRLGAARRGARHVPHAQPAPDPIAPPGARPLPGGVRPRNRSCRLPELANFMFLTGKPRGNLRQKRIGRDFPPAHSGGRLRRDLSGRAHSWPATSSSGRSKGCGRAPPADGAAPLRLAAPSASPFSASACAARLRTAARMPDLQRADPTGAGCGLAPPADCADPLRLLTDCRCLRISFRYLFEPMLAYCSHELIQTLF